MAESLRWVAKEYKHHERELGWYAGLFLFGAVLIAWALYTNNIILTILFVLMLLVVYVLSNRRPNEIIVELSDKGINLNGVVYPYRNLKNFCVFQHGDHTPELIVETNSFLNRHLAIELEDQDQEEVAEFMRRYVREIQDYEENFIDHLIRQLRI